MRHLRTSLGFEMACAFVATLLVGMSTSTFAEDDAAAPKISTFASADDLSAELKILTADLEKAVVSKEEYDSQIDGPIHPRRQHDHADRHRRGSTRPG